MNASSQERLLRVTDEHWITYVFPLLCTLAVSVAGILLLLLAGYASTILHWVWPWTFLAGTALFLASLHAFFFFCIGKSLSLIVITDRRIVCFDDILIVREDLTDVSFDRMKSVEARKHGVLQYALNYGSLLFEGGGKGRIDYVPHPSSMARDIVQAMGMS